MGFGVAFTPFNLLMAVAGVLVGILIGALPGVGPPSGVAMLLPLTFGMDPTSGIIMLAALYAGTMYGGTITAVLINTPGESASVVTCLDGYQMALQGRAGPALGIAAIGSFIAGTIGVVLLMLVSPVLARWSLAFGPPETFALMLLGLTTVTLLGGDDPLKGYISMVLGLMLAMVGYDIISGDARYGFGIIEMMDGIDFLPAAIGLFGLGEVLAGAEQKGAHQLKTSLKLRDVLPSMRGLRAHALVDRARHGDGLPGRRAARRRADGGRVPRLHGGEEGVEGAGEVRQGRDQGRGRARSGEQRRRHRRDGADAHPRHPGLGHHRDHARRADDVGPAPRADAVREEPAVRLGPDRLAVHRQRPAAAS